MPLAHCGLKALCPWQADSPVGQAALGQATLNPQNILLPLYAGLSCVLFECGNLRCVCIISVLFNVLK